MKSDYIDAILRQTFEDYRLTRSERRALREVLSDADLTRDDASAIERIAFAIAREGVTDMHSLNVLGWLQDVVKTITAAQQATEPSPTELRSEALFSPGEAPRLRISSLFTHAHKSVDCCVFTITDDRISKAIAAAHKRGVRVRIITDNDKAFDRGSDVQDLASAGVPVRVDATDAHMHHKFGLFDGHFLLTGSYNWTRSAYRENEENVVITNDPHLVRRFQAQFDSLWEQLAR